MVINWFPGHMKKTKELVKNNEIYRDVYLSQVSGGVLDE